MFAYCGNGPLLYIDTQGNRYVENHPATILSDTLFQITYSDIFKDPGICLFYAFEIIDAYGDGKELCGMDAERIAKEIYAHALGYKHGETALSISNNINRLDPEDYYDYSTTESDGVFTPFLKPIGKLLTKRCGTIDVNNDDPLIFIYNLIWAYRMSGPYKAQIHLEYLSYKSQNNPHPGGAPYSQMLQ